MGRMVSGDLVLALGRSVSAAEEGRDETAVSERYEVVDRESREAAHEYDVEAATDADRV